MMMIEVSAGIIRIRRDDGRILVCQRGEGRRNAHLWEFPGGKREAGETAADCLRRELLEELSLPVDGLREVCTDVAQGIRFTFLEGIALGEPVRTEHEALRFVHPREMLSLPFCPADEPVARWLALQNPPLTAFFWDYDGTLVDSYPAMVRFLARAAERLGIRVSEGEAIELMKHSLPHAISILCRGDADMETRLMAAFREEETRMTPADTPLLPGIREAFDALSVPGARHFLVTHNSRRALDTLKAHGLLDFFTDWVTRENAFPRKPDPAAILALMRRHGIQPEEAVMIGDRPLDMEAGSAAGILTCLLDTDGRFADTPCALRASRAGELPALLAPKKPVIG